MKKKIIFVTEALWIGGIETALVNLLNRMDYDKYNVTCLVIRGSLEMADRITSKCRLIVADRENTISFPKAYKYSRLYHLTEESENPSRLHKAMMWAVPAIKWVENRLYIRYIRENLKDEHFDTCVIYSDRTAETAIRGIHADRYLMFYHHGAMRREYHDEIGYRKSEKIITVSEKTLDALKLFRPKYADKVAVLHNIVDIENVLKKSREIPSCYFPNANFNLVSCGRLSEAKGYDWAIQAMKILLDKGHTDLNWWIVGGGPDEAILRQQIEEAGIGGHFHLLGMQSNPYPYIAAADLYVQPSRYENYSVVILEAMALCKPILATIPAAQTQIRSGENGLLCEADPESIAKSIEYLYHHREDMEKYVQALKDHGLDKQNEEIMASLYRLLDRK
ncbi:MAG: glycosyltransferase [Oscillospiraceae bacterium]|nr:glycosyltransferase [Oscillospiraceae bacterium]